MRELTVGQLYLSGRTTWPERTEYLYTDNGHELRLFLADPSPEEVAAVKVGKFSFALFQRGPAIWFLFRVGPFTWSDNPFAWHLVPAERRHVPVEPQELERAAIAVILVDAGNGIVRAIRGLSFSPHFTRELHRAIREQAAAPWVNSEFDRTLSATSAALTSEEMARQALATCKGGA
jgi:hypothetical protein